MNAAPAPVADVTVRRPGIEVLLVVGVSLGSSAIYSVLSIIEKLTRNVPLNQQTTTINNSITPDRPWLDLAYQLAGIALPVVPALLALYLLWLSGDSRRIGLDLRRPGFDIGWGFALAAGIGIPGLGFYVLARYLGINTSVSPANLAENWWTVPVLIGLAAMNAVLEEVIMIGFWFTRTVQLNCARPRQLPPLPGLRRLPRQHRDGPGLRVVLPADQARRAIGRHAFPDRLLRVRRLFARRALSGVASRKQLTATLTACQMDGVSPGCSG